MRLVQFDDFHIGVLDGEQVRDISSLVDRWQPGDTYAMHRLIAGWTTLRPRIEDALQRAPALALGSVRLRAPVPTPTHLLAAPANYRAHVDEMLQQGFGTSGRVGPVAPDSADTLGFFIKATGSISGPQDPIELPVRDYPNRRFDHEGEIAFVVGKDARSVPPDRATDFIFGYTIVVDATLRGSAERTEERVQRKSFATFSPMGPCLTTADELPDWRALRVRLWLNGEQRQDARATEMIVDIPNLLSRASHVMPLRPGDVYTTGSPPGVGRIVPGDHVVVEAEGIGRMALDVIARDW